MSINNTTLRILCLVISASSKLFLGWLLSMVLLLPAAASAAVSYVDSAISAVTASTSFDVTGVNVSGTNRVMYAWVTRDATGDPGTPTCVWDSAGANESFTLVQEGSSTSRYLALFRLVNPTTGTAKTVTFGGLTALDNIGVVLVLEGVDQVTPDDTVVTDNNTTGTTDTNTVTSATGDMVVSVVTVNNQNTAGLDGSTYEREAVGNGGIGMGLLTMDGAASVDAVWTWTSNSDWRHWAFNVNAAAVAGTSSDVMLMGVGQ